VCPVLGAQLLVDTAGWPPALIDQVKRLATFENPEFHKKQAMRLSTALTPRVISCAEEVEKPGNIGQIGGGKRKVTGDLDVGMLQSLVRRDKVDDLVAGYGHVIVDECHHVPAVSFEKAMRKVRARYITGLTATPQRRDGHHPILHFQLGPTRFSVDPKSTEALRPFERRLTVRQTAFRLQDGSSEAGIQEIYTQLAADRTRNEMILDDVIGALEAGRSPILLTERRDHLDYFAGQLGRVARHLVVRGGMGL